MRSIPVASAQHLFKQNVISEAPSNFSNYLHRALPSDFHTASGQERDRRVVASAKSFVFLTKISTICAFLRDVLYFCDTPFERAVSAVSGSAGLASVIVTLHMCIEAARRYKISSRSPSPSESHLFSSLFLNWCGLKGTSASKVGKNLSNRVFVH